MSTILLLGSTGQVGGELRMALAPLGHVIAPSRHEADLAAPDSVASIIAASKPDIVVNAAAYTAVDDAETHAEQAALTNTIGVAAIAQEAAARKFWLVHYSTDYVFDGSATTPYRETDAVAPLNVYGRTKQAGEAAILASGCKHLIFRTSWVHAARGNNFIRTILRLAAQHDELKIVCDQTGTPTSARLIAEVTAHALRSILADNEAPYLASGLYHLTAEGETNWHAYARHIIEIAQTLGIPLKASPSHVLPITTDQYPRPATRPLHSVLDTSKLKEFFKVTLPPWQQDVDVNIAALSEQNR